jgi:hypothetical protein
MVFVMWQTTLGKSNVCFSLRLPLLVDLILVLISQRRDGLRILHNEGLDGYARPYAL